MAIYGSEFKYDGFKRWRQPFMWINETFIHAESCIHNLTSVTLCVIVLMSIHIQWYAWTCELYAHSGDKLSSLDYIYTPTFTSAISEICLWWCNCYIQFLLSPCTFFSAQTTIISHQRMTISFPIYPEMKYLPGALASVCCVCLLCGVLCHRAQHTIVRWMTFSSFILEIFAQ